MKSWEVVGYVTDGCLVCKDHVPDNASVFPIFACDANEDDYCDVCLNDWIEVAKPHERKQGAPKYVYLLG